MLIGMCVVAVIVAVVVTMVVITVDVRLGQWHCGDDLGFASVIRQPVVVATAVGSDDVSALDLCEVTCAGLVTVRVVVLILHDRDDFDLLAAVLIGALCQLLGDIAPDWGGSDDLQRICICCLVGTALGTCRQSGGQPDGCE